MPRVTKANIAKKKHKKVLNSTKGHYGALKTLDVRYSSFIDASKKKNIILNRKILSDIAVNDFETFKKVVKVATD